MIPDLPATYVEHLVAPNGIGDVPDAHAAGEVGSMVGGLGVRMTLAYEAGGNGDARIALAAGRAFGSPAPLAPLSWLAGAVVGQTWQEACTHTPERILAALSDGRSPVLPEPVARSAEYAVQALRRALGCPDAGAPADPTGGGILVCRCLGVGDRVIRRAIRAGARDPEQVGDATSACTGCRSCRPDVLALIDEESGGITPPPDPTLHPAARITLARVGPILRGLGLPLADARVVGPTVRIRLGEPAAGAAISPIGAVAVTRHILRDIVADGIHVEPDA